MATYSKSKNSQHGFPGGRHQTHPVGTRSEPAAKCGWCLGATTHCEKCIPIGPSWSLFQNPSKCKEASYRIGIVGKGISELPNIGMQSAQWYNSSGACGGYTWYDPGNGMVGPGHPNTGSG